MIFYIFFHDFATPITVICLLVSLYFLMRYIIFVKKEKKNDSAKLIKIFVPLFAWGFILLFTTNGQFIYEHLSIIPVCIVVTAVFYINYLICTQSDRAKFMIFVVSASLTGLMILSFLVFVRYALTVKAPLKDRALNTVLDTIKVADDGKLSFYLSQHAKFQSFKSFPTTLYVASQKRKEDKAITFSSPIIGMSVTNNGSFVCANNDIVMLYDYKKEEEKVIFSADAAKEEIVFSSIANDDASFIVFTVAKVPKYDMRRTGYPFASYCSLQGSDIYIYDVKNDIKSTISYVKNPDQVLTAPTISNAGKVTFSIDNQIYLYDTSTKKVSVLTDGEYPLISKNGEYIVFREALPQKLQQNKKEEGVASPPNVDTAQHDTYSIYRYDIKNKKRELISPARNSKDALTAHLQHGAWQDMDHRFSNTATFYSISADGNIIAYSSIKNPRKKTEDGKKREFLVSYYDVKAKKLTIVAIFAEKNNEMTPTITLSDNGRYLLFTGNGLTEKEDKFAMDVYLKDMQTGALRCLSTPLKRQFLYMPKDMVKIDFSKFVR